MTVFEFGAAVGFFAGSDLSTDTDLNTDCHPLILLVQVVFLSLILIIPAEVRSVSVTYRRPASRQRRRPACTASGLRMAACVQQLRHPTSSACWQ